RIDDRSGRLPRLARLVDQHGLGLAARFAGDPPADAHSVAVVDRTWRARRVKTLGPWCRAARATRRLVALAAGDLRTTTSVNTYAGWRLAPELGRRQALPAPWSRALRGVLQLPLGRRQLPAAVRP